MTTYAELIETDLTTAMKTQDKPKTNTLRSVKSAFDYHKGIRGKITDQECISIIEKLCKQRKESAKIYEDNNRQDLAKQELSELEMISSYLPPHATQEDLTAWIEEAVTELQATSVRQMGQVIKQVKTKAGEKLVDGASLSDMVRKRLNQN